jgi:hypothetical protein
MFNIHEINSPNPAFNRELTIHQVCNADMTKKQLLIIGD